MSPDDTRRHELFEAARAALGDRPAETLMESLPPDRWDELAKKADLEPFATRADLDRFATKADLEIALRDYPTKTDLEIALRDHPTKTDLEIALRDHPTKADLKEALRDHPTRSDLEHFATKADLHRELTQQTWRYILSMIALFTANIGATATIVQLSVG